MRKLTLGVLVSLLVLMAGCTTLNEFAVYGDDHKPVNFKGIADLVEAHEHVNVVFVHGMAGYACPSESKCDPSYAIDVLREKLPGMQDVGKENYTFVHDTEVIGSMSLIKTANENRTINYYTLRWAPTVEYKKYHLQEDSFGATSKHRLVLLNNIKNQIINRGLADAALYMGDYKQPMQRPVKQAINLITDQSQDKQYANAIITFSLGSSIVLDTLGEMQKSGDNEEIGVAQAFSGNTRLFFMLANQLPLIALSDTPSTPLIQAQDSSPASMSGLQTFINAKNSNTRSDKPWIVSISDPNDLLSYPVLWKTRQQYPDTFVTVITSIQKTGLWIPFVGEVTNPLYAHIGYGEDEKTLDLILNGYKVK